HVGGSAGTCLEDIDNKLRIEFPVNDFLRRGNDGFPNLRIEQPQIHVGACGGQLDKSQSPDEFTGKTKVADGEVFDRPLRLSAVEGVRRDAHFTHRVFLKAEAFSRSLSI